MHLILSDLTYIQLAFGSFVFAISFVLLCRRKHLKLNEPLLVPYKYPIIGHTIDYYKDCENFIKKCQEEYGEIFSLYVFGRVITFVGRELSAEVFKHDKSFNFREAHRESFPMDDFMYRPKKFFKMLSKTVQVNLSGGLKHYTERVQRQLNKSIDEIIGDGKVLEPPLEHIQFIVAKPIAATLVGEELCDDKELVNSFAYATSDFIPFLSVPPILSFIHHILHTKFLIFLFKYSNNPFKVHRGLIKKKITPVIEKRLNEMKKLGDTYIPPTDILQKYIEMFHKNYVIDVDVVTDYMIVTIFASVHTTSMYLTFSLQELANNPQFYKEILEEQEQLYKSNNDTYYSIEQVAKMEKLDSFVRETLRMRANIVSLPHKTLSPYFTFSNGYQVPKDRFVYIRSNEIHFDEKLQGKDPNEFNAFRHLEKKLPAARIDKNHVIFGLGKHACPGRAFAISEIKLAMHFLLLKYNIRKISNEKIKPKVLGYYLLPSNEGLIFEKRYNDSLSMDKSSGLVSIS